MRKLLLLCVCVGCGETASARSAQVGPTPVITPVGIVLPTPGGPCGNNVFEIKKVDGKYHVYTVPPTQAAALGCGL